MAIPELKLSERTSRAIEQAVEILKRELRPRKIILFGSTVRGTTNEYSDIDLMVIMDRYDSQWDELVRASGLVAPLRSNIEVLVFSTKDVDDWGGVVNHVINEALTYGVVLYDAA